MSNENTTTAVLDNAKIDASGKVKVDFGSGRYSQFMTDCFKQSMNYFGWTSEQAEKFARNAASEIGRCMGNATIQVGSVTKKGFITLKDVAKAKIAITPVLRVVKILDCLNTAWENGMEYDSQVTIRKEVLEGLDLPQPTE